MDDMTNLAHEVTFAPQINAEQVKLIAEKGYKTVICNRPDGEDTEQTVIAEIEAACAAAGLAFKAVPFSGGDMSPENVQEFAEYFNSATQPVYMYCRTGNRSKSIYQAAIQLDLLG